MVDTRVNVLFIFECASQLYIQSKYCTLKTEQCNEERTKKVFSNDDREDINEEKDIERYQTQIYVEKVFPESNLRNKEDKG